MTEKYRSPLRRSSSLRALQLTWQRSLREESPIRESHTLGGAMRLLVDFVRDQSTSNASPPHSVDGRAILNISVEEGPGKIQAGLNRGLRRFLPLATAYFSVAAISITAASAGPSLALIAGWGAAVLAKTQYRSERSSFFTGLHNMRERLANNHAEVWRVQDTSSANFDELKPTLEALINDANHKGAAVILVTRSWDVAERSRTLGFVPQSISPLGDLSALVRVPLAIAERVSEKSTVQKLGQAVQRGLALGPEPVVERTAIQRPSSSGTPSVGQGSYGLS